MRRLVGESVLLTLVMTVACGGKSPSGSTPTPVNVEQSVQASPKHDQALQSLPDLASTVPQDNTPKMSLPRATSRKPLMSRTPSHIRSGSHHT